MFNWSFLKDFVKKNYQIIYSLALIVIVPVGLFLHTYFFVGQMQRNMDVELQSKALLIENIVETAIANGFEPTLLQEKIDRISEKNPEIASLRVALPEAENESFKVVAAKNNEAIGQVIRETQNVLAWHEDEAFAHLTIEDSERFWEVTKTARDAQGEKRGLIIVQLSLADIDLLTRSTIKQAYIFLVILVVIILLLVVNNAQLFQYAALYRKLREVDRMKDEFISMVSHELRTPIVAIRGYLSLVLKKSAIDTQTKSDLEKISSSSDLLGILVDDILEVTRIEQGKVEISLQPIDVSEIVKEVVSGLKVKADEKNLELSYQEAKNLPKVIADPLRLKQILINLINNAIKFTFEGKVTISTELDDKEQNVKIKVSDTGIGISAKARESLFQKFYRVKSRKTDEVSGTGLGLWITKNLTELMNGEIYVDSIEGRGSEFSVFLPVVKEEK